MKETNILENPTLGLNLEAKSYLSVRFPQAQECSIPRTSSTDRMNNDNIDSQATTMGSNDSGEARAVIWVAGGIPGYNSGEETERRILILLSSGARMTTKVLGLQFLREQWWRQQ